MSCMALDIAEAEAARAAAVVAVAVVPPGQALLERAAWTGNYPRVQKLLQPPVDKAGLSALRLTKEQLRRSLTAAATRQAELNCQLSALRRSRESRALRPLRPVTCWVLFTTCCAAGTEAAVARRAAEQVARDGAARRETADRLIGTAHRLLAELQPKKLAELAALARPPAAVLRVAQILQRLDQHVSSVSTEGGGRPMGVVGAGRGGQDQQRGGQRLRSWAEGRLRQWDSLRSLLKEPGLIDRLGQLDVPTLLSLPARDRKKLIEFGDDPTFTPEAIRAATATAGPLVAWLQVGARHAFLDFTLSFHCLSLTFPCLFTAFPWPFQVLPLRLRHRGPLRMGGGSGGSCSAYI